MFWVEGRGKLLLAWVEMRKAVAQVAEIQESWEKGVRSSSMFDESLERNQDETLLHAWTFERAIERFVSLGIDNPTDQPSSEEVFAKKFKTWECLLDLSERQRSKDWKLCG